MTEKVYKYRLVDKEDPEIFYDIVYKANTCSCLFGECHDDELEIWEEGVEHPYRTKIMGFESKSVIRGLLEGEWEISK